jgi:peptidoglycan/xylan/chitin deacetylase (PgdA/CDA1 family)
MIRRALRTIRNKALNVLDTPAVILLYHRVTTLQHDPQLLSVTPSHFDQHLKLLKKKYNVLSVEEFTHHVLAEKGFPRNSVFITFDDGYADNHYEARPILEGNDLQAVFYIATAHISTPYEMWWDNLERIFLEKHDLPKSLSIAIGGGNYQFSTGAASDRRITYGALHPLIKNCTPAMRDAVIDELISWSGLEKVGRPTHRMLTFDEIKTFASSKAVVIGAHTHNHPKLSVCSKEEQYHEIASSKSNLEMLLERRVKHFSYPFGSKSDYNSHSLEICKTLGFDMVSANFHRQVHRWDNRFELPRILVRDWNADEFEVKMNSFFNE